MDVGTTFSAKEVDELLKAEGLEPRTYDYVNTKYERYYPLDANGERWAEYDEWRVSKSKRLPLRPGGGMVVS